MKSYLSNYRRLTGHDWVENIAVNDNDNSKLIQYTLRLQQIEDEIERGRIIGLPCDIGDPVWTIMEFPQEGDCPIYQVVSGVVKAFSLEDDFYVVVRHGVNRSNYYSLDKCIFNEEEAYKKLKELNDKREYYKSTREAIKEAMKNE